jgi:trans-4-hydroxy-L-proline dehydratase
LVRTLLIDDCIDRGREYYDGGARHNWSVINIVGLSNAIDSLEAVRRAVYSDARVSATGLLEALRADFHGHDDLRAYLQRCPRFGNDEPEADALAARLSATVYREFKRYAPWRGGRFLCGTLMFVTYGWYGRPVGATPDGRLAGTPVGDSAGPGPGRDRHGPTAMLRSVAALAQAHAPGTLVVNIRVSAEHVTTPEGRARLRALISAYFELGGLQLQVNVVDQEVLRDALAHPDRHGDLIVRVGGYSEYFNRLDDDLKRSILERTEHR